MPEYTREQLTKLYKKLPDELKEWTSSEEINEFIYQVLEKNDVLDDMGNIICDLVRNVLYGLLPPEEFHDSLIKEAGLEQEIAKKIDQEINRFVFFPVKQSLASLYKIETTTEEAKPKPAQTKTIEPIEQVKSDSYLEHIEQ